MKRIGLSILFFLVLISIFPVRASAPVSAESSSGEDPPTSVDSMVEVVDDYFTVEHIIYDDGSIIQKATINGPPHPLSESEAAIAATIQPLPSEGVINGFPSYSWVFGCSAVAGAMIAAYYDRNGYPNIYTGPTDNGVMPITDESWAKWTDSAEAEYPNNPLVASHQGVDGRTTRGSIDDYWVAYQSSADDPYITGGWQQHAWGTAIGDYMKTSQSPWPYFNRDGGTSFYTLDTSEKLTCTQMENLKPEHNQTYYMSQDDGTYGRKRFFEDRGYTVTECYNQLTYNQANGGFSLADLQAEIDAGHPVFINVVGHSMVAYGYQDNTVYIRTTQDNDPDTHYKMEWDATPTFVVGGEDRPLHSVSIVKLESTLPTPPTPIGPTGTVGVDKPRYQWTEIAGADAYRIQLYRGSNIHYTKTVWGPYCSSSVCMKRFWTSLWDGHYKWRVRTKVDAIWGAYSEFKWFKVDAIPTAYSPRWGITTDTPRYNWSKNVNAGSYQIQLKTRNGDWVYLKDVWGPYCSSTTCMKRFWIHLDEGYYMWRVRARVNGVLGFWSDWQWFHVDVGT